MYESSRKTCPLAATAYDCTLNQAMITFSLSTAPDFGSTFWMPKKCVRAATSAGSAAACAGIVYDSARSEAPSKARWNLFIAFLLECGSRFDSRGNLHLPEHPGAVRAPR